MQPYVNAAGFCENLLQQMSTIQGENYAFNLGRVNGTLDFITDPTVNPIRSELVSTQNGEKLRKARVVYKQRTKRCDILTGSDALARNVCDTPEESGEGNVIVDINKKITLGQPRQFSKQTMANICQDTQAFIDEYLESDMRAMREELSKQVLVLIDAGAGINNLFDGGTQPAGDSKQLQLLGANLGQPIPLTGNWVDIGLNYQHNQLSGVPVLIGDGNVKKYFDLANLACCNSTTPLNEAVAGSGVAFYHDQNSLDAIGQNQFIVVAPGSTALLWYNENAILRGQINNELEAHTVIPDPTNPNIMWDFYFYWDKCGGTNSRGAWVYDMSAWYDVFNTFQPDSFAGATSPATSPPCTDELNGMTGIFKYVATTT